MSEDSVTQKQLYDLISAVELRLGSKIDKISNDFHTFEAGRITQLIEDVAILKTKDQTSEKTFKSIDNDAEKRKDWMWGAMEKIIFIVLGALISLGILLLQNTHILNLTPVK